MSNTTGVQAIYEQYTELFGTNLPMHEQFFIYVRNVFQGDFGFSFSQYPRTVANVIRSSLVWTIALQLPAILVGWFIGNLLGALAAYRRGGFDKALMPASISSFPISVWGSSGQLSSTTSCPFGRSSSSPSAARPSVCARWPSMS
jgi:peptide/nickel transport system permease protein